MAAYSKSTFGMFNGQEERVEMVFHNRMMDVVIDKFGKDVWLNKVDDWHFKISVPRCRKPAVLRLGVRSGELRDDHWS